ncbi:MmcQ/YjbR family DNA-binding protein [Jiangella ureilytica]|uniref:MmcQ/YjbR family DNA-binding protein n=1 Tax=Jiangella ureilytica TaxID=2530374 RepID=A0A4R4RT32_9ACTN|nr:MmcQ/YjbR family DNA-binding protein [Jiangella ureilytica]TDC51962.1 MmcQ/YjbR family DNA-binding protein [Jiangella ureilytica]
MASWDDVSRIATALPEADEHSGRDGLRSWRIRDKTFAWERPLRKADLEALGDAAPDGPVLGVWVADLGVKEALLADDPVVFFTTPHFDGYPAVLVLLDRIDEPELTELMVEAWLDRAPKKVAQAYLDETEPR